MTRTDVTTDNVVSVNPVINYFKVNKGLLLAVVALLAVFGLLTKGGFLGITNLINLFRVASLNAIAAFGVTMIIITGGIDLSVGSVMAVASTYCALLIVNGVNVVIALIIGVAMGTAIGAVNGFIISHTTMPAFIVTLGTMNIGRGVAYMCSAGIPIRISGNFGQIGNGYLFNIIPYPILYCIVILIICWVLMNKTKFGRAVYAIGGNAEAASFSGINNTKIVWIVYTVAGLLYGVYGVVSCSRLYSGQPTLGQGSELTAIAAAVVGGTSMSGGVGRIGATFIGALIMELLDGGLNYMNVPFYWQDVAEGIVVLGAVYFDLRTKKK